MIKAGSLGSGFLFSSGATGRYTQAVLLYIDRLAFKQKQVGNFVRICIVINKIFAGIKLLFVIR